MSIVKDDPRLPTKMEQLEALALTMPQVSASVVHAFAAGIYIRSVTLKAGSIVMGHRHRTTHLNIMLSGRLTLFHPDGRRDELTAPVVIEAMPGRKVAYVHEDTTWLNLYPSEETDVDALEDRLLDKSEGWQEYVSGHQVDRTAEREDYAAFLSEFGFDEAYVRRASENTVDQIPLPAGAYGFRVGKSQIEGRGLLASSDLIAGEIIGPARIGNCRTPIGRYANHSPTPNAVYFVADETIWLMAIQPIRGNVGGLDGEEITVNYRDALTLSRSITQ